jgi:hypothetical protein
MLKLLLFNCKYKKEEKNVGSEALNYSILMHMQEYAEGVGE